MTTPTRGERVLTQLPLWIAALWWGSMSAVGFLVVPLLFAHLPSPAMAGTMAAKLFTAQTWLALVCGLFLLLISGKKRSAAQLNHDILMDRLANRITDKAVLRLIRRYLQAGIMPGGVAGAQLIAAPYADSCISSYDFYSGRHTAGTFV